MSRSMSRELIEFVKGRLELLAFYETVAKHGDTVTLAEKELNEAQSRNLDTVLVSRLELLKDKLFKITYAVHTWIFYFVLDAN